MVIINWLIHNAKLLLIQYMSLLVTLHTAEITWRRSETEFFFLLQSTDLQVILTEV